MPPTTAEHRYVGTYANTLANGRPVEPGEFVKLTEEEAKENQGMIDDGTLMVIADQDQVAATDAAEKAARKAGIALDAVKGTGADGQVTVEDVEKFVSKQEAEQGKEG